MTKSELVKIATSWAKENNMNLPPWANTIGIRYDDKIVTVGEELECSRDNSDREDPRDFPKFGSENFDSLTRLPGTSAYKVCESNCFDPEDEDDYYDDFDTTWIEYINSQEDSAWAHCSIVIGKSCDWAEDEGEVLLEGCEVVKVLW